jgi:hypothetical protein
MKKFILYLIRWQLSTPILWLAVRHLGASVYSTIIANLIGGTIFFWVDRFIFTSKAVEQWHFKEKGKCGECGVEGVVRRLVTAKGYDRTNDTPIFLCSSCSDNKVKVLRQKGYGVQGVQSSISKSV